MEFTQHTSIRKNFGVKLSVHLQPRTTQHTQSTGEPQHVWRTDTCRLPGHLSKTLFQTKFGLFWHVEACGSWSRGMTGLSSGRGVVLFLLGWRLDVLVHAEYVARDGLNQCKRLISTVGVLMPLPFLWRNCIWCLLAHLFHLNWLQVFKGTLLGLSMVWCLYLSLCLHNCIQQMFCIFQNDQLSLKEGIPHWIDPPKVSLTFLYFWRVLCKFMCSSKGFREALLVLKGLHK